MQVRAKAGEGSRRALGAEGAERASPPEAAARPPKGPEGSEADLREMLGARDELMNRCLSRQTLSPFHPHPRDHS